MMSTPNPKGHRLVHSTVSNLQILTAIVSTTTRTRPTSTIADPANKA